MLIRREHIEQAWPRRRSSALSAGVLVTNHAYGKPLPRDVILNKASFPAHKGKTAKAAFDAVRQKPFITDHGKRGIQLDTAAFGALIQFLHDECDWERFELELRIKHFEGWENINWRSEQ